MSCLELDTYRICYYKSIPYEMGTTSLMKSTDFKIHSASTNVEEHLYRTPIKFGGRVSAEASILNATVEGQNAGGTPSRGVGSMTLGVAWSWPDPSVAGDVKLQAMVTLAERIARRLPELDAGDPMQIGVQIEELGLSEAKALARELDLASDIPPLAVLVVACVFDAAVHDAFGKAVGASVYDCYGSDFINKDLSHYLDEQFRGEFPDQYTLRKATSPMPLYHLVGALDPLTDADVQKPVGDGHPETLQEWIKQDQLTHLKIKLNGQDLQWDVERVIAVDAAASALYPNRDWQYSLDFNEMCPDVDYLLESLAKIKEGSPAAFERIQYIEQPTARDLFSPGAFDMHEAAKIKPIVIDESLLGYDSLLRARELGYTGVALKACKGQTQSLLMGAAALKMGLFLCVQDLTCPSRSFAWSAGLASRIPTVAAIEGNARQFMPAANEEWIRRFPGLFVVKDGRIDPSVLSGNGLGYGD